MSHYAICQYGNVMTGEYLNIAVFAYDNDEDKPKVYSQFALNWARINEVFESKTKDPIFEHILDNHLKKIATKEELQKWIKDSQSPWSSLMFTELRASDMPAEQLVEEMAKRFLNE